MTNKDQIIWRINAAISKCIKQQHILFTYHPLKRIYFTCLKVNFKRNTNVNAIDYLILIK